MRHEKNVGKKWMLARVRVTAVLSFLFLSYFHTLHTTTQNLTTLLRTGTYIHGKLSD